MMTKYQIYGANGPISEYNDARKFGKYVETIGYVPIDRQVDSFFRAGERWLDTFSDKDYDSVDDMPVDDAMLDVRDFELEDVGHEMANMLLKSERALTASVEQAKQATEEASSSETKLSENEATKE